MHTDYQGSVVMVTDSAGIIEQHTTYYPYGEPHRAPSGQPILYGGKERLAPTDDYNYGARRHHSPAINWPTPDNKAADYAWVSPYAFCAGNPIARKELNGDEWKVVNDDDNRPYAFEWVDSKDSCGDDGKILPDHYATAILFSSEGAKKEYNPKSGYNMGSSLCTVYLEDGTTAEYDACTYPSDTDKYSMIPEGQYEAQVGKHRGKYDALRVSDCGTTNFNANKISLDEPNKAHPEVNHMTGTNVHKDGLNNLTGMYKDKKDNNKEKAISEGCILIDRERWADFMSHFQKNTTIGIILNR